MTPRRIAAKPTIAWGHSLTTDCFALDEFRAFYDANLGHGNEGNEDICGNGVALTADAQRLSDSSALRCRSTARSTTSALAQ